MLVLTRKIGETIVIGDNVRVTIVGVGPGRVKIGIDAPPDVRVNREEIHDRIAEERSAPVTANQPADEPHMVAGDSPKLHNRIAAKLAPVPAEATAAVSEPTGERMARFRRKPR